MEFVLLTAAMVLCIAGKMQLKTIITVFIIPVFLHLAAIKRQKLSYILIAIDSILIALSLVYANVDFMWNWEKDTVFKSGVSDNTELFNSSFPWYPIVIIATAVCIASWIIEIALHVIFKKKQPALQTNELQEEQEKAAYVLMPPNLQDSVSDFNSHVVKGKNGYYISYETKNVFGNEEPTVVLRYNNIVILQYQELIELCYNYLTNQASAIKEVKGYGIEQEITNLAKFCVTAFGCRFFDRDIKTDMEIIDQKTAEMKNTTSSAINKSK